MIKVYAKTVEYRLNGKAAGKLKNTNHYVVAVVCNEMTRRLAPGLDGNLTTTLWTLGTAEAAKAKAVELAAESGATLGEHVVAVAKA